MCRYLYKAIKISKNQRTMTRPKDYSNTPATGPKEMEIKELPDKEFKIIFLEMLRDL